MTTFRCPVCNSPLSVWGVSASGPQFDMLADSSKSFRRDAALPSLPMPPPAAMFRQAQPAQRWDVGTAVKASIAAGAMGAMLMLPAAIAGKIAVWLAVGLVSFALVVISLRVLEKTAEKVITLAVIGIFSGVIINSCEGIIEIPWWFPGLVFSIGTPLSFFLIGLHPRSILSLVEKTVQLDLNRDGQIGEPPLPTVTVRMEKPGGGWSFDDLPSPSRDGLFRFAQALSIQAVTFSERGASKYGYSRQLWKALSEKFLQHEPPWARDLGGRQGLELTGTGKRLVNAIAETEPESEE